MINPKQSFKSKIQNLPARPGVYRFLNKNGDALYIGKAKNLRARVRQYFNGNDERPQIPFLMKEAADFDYTVVNTELDSLYLERTLIQTHHPKYNIELKDDKNYAFLAFDYSTEIPQLAIRRRVDKLRALKARDKPDYFGPYTSAKKIRDLIFAARRIFGLCGAQKTGRPCFHYHLRRCPGVCAGQMSPEEYARHLGKIKLFLAGQIAPVRKSLKAEMSKAAGAKKFEAAARLRDQWRALQMLEQKQNMILTKPVSWDAIGLAQDESVWCANLFKIRNGRLLDKTSFILSPPRMGPRPRQNAESPAENGESRAMQTFLENYYADASDAPKTILVSAAAPDENLIKSLFQSRFANSISIVAPKKGKALQLVKLSRTNAAEHLKNYLNEKAGYRDKIQRGLNRLKEIFGLPAPPRRMESFDISHIQGANAVGSMAVFEAGRPKKSEYRKFTIKSPIVSAGGLPKPDDFAMMREVLGRRFGRILNQASGIVRGKKWPVPDLILIDGGKGQLNAALRTLRKFQMASGKFQIIGLAKRMEEIFIPGKKAAIILSSDDPGLQLLQKLRDEAHRFGIAFHRRLRSRQAVQSALDDTPGLGPKTKKLLKTRFGTVANIRRAGLEELREAVGEKLAERIKREL